MNITALFSNLIKKESGSWHTVFSLGQSSQTKSVKEMYFGIMFACVDAIATKVSEAKWGLYQKNGDEWEEIQDHEILKRLRRPNSDQSFTDFMYLMSNHIDTYGQIVIYPERTAMSSKRVIELHLLNPGNLATALDDSQPYLRVNGYRYYNGKKTFEFKPEELINIVRPDPFNPTKGLSTVQMARYEGTAELNSLKMNNSFYENGAWPGGVIETDQPIAPDVLEKLKAGVRRAYEGVQNSYKMMFLTNGLKYNVTSPSQRDMQYVDQRKLNRDQILTIFKTPKSVMAISDNVNKATADVEYAAWIANVIKPRLELIFDKLNTNLMPLFDPTGKLALRYEDPTPLDKQFALDEKVASVNTWRTVNEVRQLDGLDPIEGGDELPGNSPEPAPDDTQNDPNPKDEPKKHLHKEANPNPDEVKGRENKEYTRRRNAYSDVKLVTYAQEVSKHYNQLLKDITKAPIKKGIEDDFDGTPEVIYEKIMPEKEKREAWKLLLFLLILKVNTQIWKVAQKQLKEVYGLNAEMNDMYERILSSRATATAKSMSDTVFATVKATIAKEVASGNTDLRDIKKAVASILKDAKPWKAEQVARTELAWAYGEAQTQTYKDNNVTKVKWITAGDPCDDCASNDGEVREIGATFPSGHDREPVHPGCKCEVVPVF